MNRRAFLLSIPGVAAALKAGDVEKAFQVFEEEVSSPVTGWSKAKATATHVGPGGLRSRFTELLAPGLKELWYSEMEKLADEFPPIITPPGENREIH